MRGHPSAKPKGLRKGVCHTILGLCQTLRYKEGAVLPQAALQSGEPGPAGAEDAVKVEAERELGAELGLRKGPRVETIRDEAVKMEQ